ncbi:MULTISPECIES: type II toxin-antitoxin system death-on-curing family toxin [Proteus]|uniref:type II toxin-antitoxin system death-on-curing family toxin n=1 Tax=Proteus TaxID=583 RepID=UPI001B9846D5|nr:type II toxin-antitoxin system death-on-curing family toxin [Proteus mirabilis]MDC9763740.1 type II toxin-antitoxin system death-on-curing family toxin [Proteus mirabilis]HBC7479008.1 type II toxin-antitoxin system death-on-curing family toxin [Proteus mirabilis]
MINYDDVVHIHAYLTEHYENSEDPIYPPGIKDEALLDSAIARPFMTVNGKDAYPEVMDKAAALFHAIISNHTFFNGNKRVALLTTMCFLDFNGYWLDKCDDLELFEFTRKIAAHEIAADRKNEIKVIKIFLKKNSRKRKYEDQQLSLHALTQHLNNAGFKLIDSGDYYEIYKNKKRYTKILKKGASGKEHYDPPYIKSLRKKLLLTPTHGWDSMRFYEISPSLTENIGELLLLRGEVMDWLAKI